MMAEELPKICHCSLTGLPVVVEDRFCELHKDTFYVGEFTPKQVQKCFDWYALQLETIKKENQRLRDMIKNVREAVK